MDLMSNVDEDNFDCAFDLLGPSMPGIVQFMLLLTPEAPHSSLALPTQDPPLAGIGEIPINKIYLPKRSFATEVLHGTSANVERGALGLVHV